ncbi:NAD(P)-binding domain-containing protein, partial [Granulosicoccus sp.]|nr:NAD(P)-binding domain-containing protein [Granulosicoccus sp.]
MSDKADIAVIGLAVMGQNLILNMNDHDFKVMAYNRTVEKTHEFLEGSAKDTHIRGTDSLEELCEGLSSPRIIMLMVQAGPAVDSVIEQLTPLLDKGDIIIDGGNSKFDDSERRANSLKEQGLLFVGTGVSGG